MPRSTKPKKQRKLNLNCTCDQGRQGELDCPYHRAPYLPTEAEIKARTAEIQAGWTERVEIAHRAMGTPEAEIPCLIWNKTLYRAYSANLPPIEEWRHDTEGDGDS